MPLPTGFKEMAELLPGIDTMAFLSAMEQTPTIGVRINPLKLKELALTGYPFSDRVVWNDEGFYLDSRPVFTLNPLLHAGAIYVQDPSSMVYGKLTEIALSLLPANRRSAPWALDMCASPGGKTTAMISCLPKDGVIVANEYVGQRVGALRENLAKWGFPSSIVCSSDSSGFASAGELFDIVAVDAPCSGEGMMRKEEVARTQWSEKLIADCAALQKEILINACKALRPGGILIYSTCTFNTQENEGNLDFLVKNLGLAPIATGIESQGGILPALSGDYPALRFMPHSTRGEGLFVAMLRKQDEATSVDSYSLPGRNDRKKSKGRVATDINPGLLSQWLDPSVDWSFISDGKRAEALSPGVAELCGLLESHVKMLDKGVAVSGLKGRDWIPAAPLALSSAFRRGSIPEVEIDQTTALSYLRGEALGLPDAPKGYLAVCYQGVPLGFVKNIGSRANNLFPKQWKIRYV